MAIPASATYECVTVVPDDSKRLGHSWPVRRRTRGHSDDASTESWLVGLSLQITDAGPTPDAGWHRGRWFPSVQRALIQLSLPDWDTTKTRLLDSFHVDMDFVSSLREGDTLYLTRTSNSGLGLSVVRGESLVVAAGAVTSVPLGSDLVARYPGNLMQAIDGLFREVDADYRSPVVPIEIETEGQRRLLMHANIRLGPYRIYVVHGFYPGIPGAAECLAISRSGVFSETAASSTAQLLGGGDIEHASGSLLV